MAFLGDVQTVLEADATLMALLTGGVHIQTEITRQYTPSAFDANGEIEPCCLINFESEAAAGPFEDSSQVYFRVFFYERSGYVSIDSARDRVYTLLHRQRIGTTRGWEVRHADDILGQEDQALDCSLILSRYMRYRVRA
jgi:hypothetical protein